MRLIWLFLTLALLVIVPFLVWGDFFEGLFTADGAVGAEADA